MSLAAKSRLTYYMLVITTLLALCLVCTWVWAKYIDESWLYYQNRPFPLKLTQIYPGDVVPLEIERCNNSAEFRTYGTTHNLRDLKTGIITLLPDAKVEIEPGCHRGNSRFNIIPASQKTGTYTVFGRAIIGMRIGTREIPWESEPFEVLPPKLATQITPGPIIEYAPKGVTESKGTFWGK